VRDHHRKLLGIMAVAVVDFLRQGHLAVGMAKQGVAHLAQRRATLCVFAAFRAIASPMKRLNNGEVIEEFWAPCYRRFRGGACEINHHAAS